MTDPSPGSVPSRDASRPVAKAGFSDLLPRVVSAVVLVILALGTAVLGGQIFDLFWWAAALAILWEWEHLVVPVGAMRAFATGGVALAVAAPLVHIGTGAWSIGVLAVGGAATAAVATGPDRWLAGCGVLYAGALVLAVTLLRASFPFGLESIVWLFAVVWGTDVMAYFGGRLIGGPKLWPRLSPSKTWSGFLVGIACGALAGLAVAPAPGPYAMLLLLGLVAGALAQGGDILESALKRRFGVKDASHLIPGHGGVMDRLDGFIAAAVFAALLGVSRYGTEAPGTGLFRW